MEIVLLLLTQNNLFVALEYSRLKYAILQSKSGEIAYRGLLKLLIKHKISSAQCSHGEEDHKAEK